MSHLTRSALESWFQRAVVDQAQGPGNLECPGLHKFRWMDAREVPENSSNTTITATMDPANFQLLLLRSTLIFSM